MKRYFLRTLLAVLTLALLLTACGQQSDDSNDAPPDAQPGNLYEDFFTGNVTATANLINAGVEASTASFRAPDVYATKGVDGSDMDWTITRFALLDLDGDGTDELVLETTAATRNTSSSPAMTARSMPIRSFTAAFWPPRQTAPLPGRTARSTTATPASASKTACWSTTILPP